MIQKIMQTNPYSICKNYIHKQIKSLTKTNLTISGINFKKPLLKLPPNIFLFTKLILLRKSKKPQYQNKLLFSIDLKKYNISKITFPLLTFFYSVKNIFHNTLTVYFNYQHLLYYKLKKNSNKLKLPLIFNNNKLSTKRFNKKSKSVTNPFQKLQNFSTKKSLKNTITYISIDYLLKTHFLQNIMRFLMPFITTSLNTLKKNLSNQFYPPLNFTISMNHILNMKNTTITYFRNHKPRMARYLNKSSKPKSSRSLRNLL